MAIDMSKMIPLEDLDKIQGVGESTKFRNDITGILVGLVEREGTYTWTDRETGEEHESPNSYIAKFVDLDTGEELLGSWPAKMVDGVKLPWNNFDEAYTIADLIRDKVPCRFRKTGERNSFTKLTVLLEVEEEDVMP